MDYTRLINEFGNPKAKIDFITLTIPASIRSEKDAYHFTKRIENLGGSIEASKRWRGQQDDWLTIHDPTPQSLQFLLDEHGDTKILSLEIAIDFTLKDSSNDPKRLVELHSWLKVCLYPQRHKRLQRVGRRKFYNLSDNSIKLDTLKTRSGNKTIYWVNPSTYEQVRLYIKTKDSGAPLEHHSVRLEVTLNGGGCYLARVHQVGLLPAFITRMRRYLSPFLNVAKGIKPKIKRTRSNDSIKFLKSASNAAEEQARVERCWERYGAAWAAKHGYRTIPDAETNRLIGSGLGRLRDSLRKLKLTRKVAEAPEYEPLERRMDTEQ